VDVKRRAARARELLNNESFMTVMQDIKNEQINRFLISATAEVDVREQAHSIVNAIRIIEAHLQSAITDEKVFDKKHKR
jgi:hypothetical protein